MINGKLLAPVGVTCGVKKGDPLSVFLFLLFIKPLGNLLWSRPDLGIPFTRVMWLTSLFFADDYTLLACSSTAAEDQLQLLHMYC